ncbi:glycosyltransferase family 2 protein [Winogradskyella flava]|uniref:glycosyltransferase family 2 protein n=1 Tax=Winogradskyella flava TaxID=1884876 RepID=UPI00248FBABF|nr:glycosyltransferase family 2 protein [Winogradskyella flava]
MKLSIIILNYNVRYFLELCLKSVEAAIQDIDAEIIVVDNNSPDDSCTMVKQLFPNVLLFKNKVNSGFSKGNNMGVAKAKGEYLCILNPDTVVAEDTFRRVLSFAESKLDLGAVGCQLIDGRGKFLPESKRQVPTARIAFQKLKGKTENYYNNTLGNADIGKTDILVGAFMLLKKTVYDQVHGFDEDYFMYGEDVDLSYKILKAGYSNYYYGETTIIHYKGESTIKDKVYAKRFYGAMEIFYRKHFKKNVLTSLFVKLGVKLAALRGGNTVNEELNFNETIVVSDSIPNSLEAHLKPPITLVSDLKDITQNVQVILDLNYLSYRSIIDFMKHNNASTQNSYRILLKNSNFILGSDSSVNRGEILLY